MTYKETTEYLFSHVPTFQRIGAQGYKEGLTNTQALDKHFGHPHTGFKTIHIAGTNGKGSCSHTIAAILQSAGYKVGLYTSPHLIDFRERIRVNGKPISEEYVTNFVETEKSFFEPLYPTFFELTTALAFKYFNEQQVDIAVIEVGLGGRLDCTNIITPIASVITNISFDHVQFLGNTLASIATEKAGIIKAGVPVVIGEHNAETRPVFEAKAAEVGTTIVFAEDTKQIVDSEVNNLDGSRIYTTTTYGQLHGELSGDCQQKNTNTILHVLPFIKSAGFNISESDIRNGFSNVCESTGLMGRWQQLGDSPKVICDTGHNSGGFKYISNQLKAQKCNNLRIVFGMVNDKDISHVLSMLPKDATYYFTKANIPRALSETELQQLASNYGLVGNSYPDVMTAYHTALSESNSDDFVFVGGSSYVVADLLSALK